MAPRTAVQQSTRAFPRCGVSFAQNRGKPQFHGANLAQTVPVVSLNARTLQCRVFCSHHLGALGWIMQPRHHRPQARRWQSSQRCHSSSPLRGCHRRRGHRGRRHHACASWRHTKRPICSSQNTTRPTVPRPPALAAKALEEVARQQHGRRIRSALLSRRQCRRCALLRVNAVAVRCWEFVQRRPERASLR